MRKKMIWVLILIMTFSLFGLLYLHLKSIDELNVALTEHVCKKGDDGKNEVVNGTYIQDPTSAQFTPSGSSTWSIYLPKESNYQFYFALFLTCILTLLGAFSMVIFILFKQKQLTEMTSDFINNMTHEFKTPISSISLAAQMLKDPNVIKSDEMYTYLSDIIGHETKRLSVLVDKVLQMSLFNKKRHGLKLESINVNELITNVVRVFNLKVEETGGKITVDLAAQNSVVYADEVHLTNVIFNLMDNALKYRRTDRSLLLEVTTWNRSNKVYVGIQDNGIGIKKEDQQKIFNKFYRVHTGNTHDVKGFGLGLTYVKKIIKDHNGTILCESELNSGTKFSIVLPEIIE